MKKKKITYICNNDVNYCDGDDDDDDGGGGGCGVDGWKGLRRNPDEDEYGRKLMTCLPKELFQCYAGGPHQSLCGGPWWW